MGCEALLVEQLTHQPQRHPSVAPCRGPPPRDRHTPQMHPLAGNPYHHLVATDGTGGAAARSPFRISAPNTGPFHRRCRPPLGEKFFDVAIARREAQIAPDRMPDDHREKAVAARGDFGRRDRLPSASLPSYPVTLTRPLFFTGGTGLPVNPGGGLGSADRGFRPPGRRHAIGRCACVIGRSVAAATAHRLRTYYRGCSAWPGDHCPGKAKPLFFIGGKNRLASFRAQEQGVSAGKSRAKMTADELPSSPAFWSMAQPVRIAATG